MTETTAPAPAPNESLIEEIFHHIPHPRLAHHHEIATPTKTTDIAKQIHGTSPIGLFNSRFGLKITLIVGTMWCAYLFTVLALVSVWSAFSTGSVVTIVAWVAQTFLQLVLLPVIIVGQNIQAKASDARADDTYKDAEAIMHECVQLQQHLQAQDQILTEMISHARTLITTLPGLVGGNGSATRAPTAE